MARAYTKSMRVTMTETKLGSLDGIHVAPFYAGHEYELTPTLLEMFEGSYKVSEPPKDENEKNAGKPPANKATAPKENK